jgi:PA14 domain-containing protein
VQSPRRRRSLVLIIGVLALTSAAWFATTRVRFASGFTARYYPGTRASGPAAMTTIEDVVSTATVRRTWTRADEPFSVVWDAFLLLNHSGPYRLSVLSDGEARLFIDDRVAFESGGPDGNVQFTADIPLTRGVHALRLEYTPARSINIALLWAPRAVDHLSPLRGRAVSPRSPSSSQLSLVSIVESLRAAIVVAWCGAYLIVLVYGIALAVRWLLRHHLRTPLPHSVVGLLIAVAALYAIGITWGVPGSGWAADEIVPADLIDAVARHFANGWWSKYPPLHFFVCAIASAPLLVWHWLDPVAFAASFAGDAMVLLFRSVTIAMAVGVVLMVYVCGRHLYAAWPAFVAAAVAALTMPMVYYGKLANVDVPFVFWFSVSLTFFMRIGVDPSAIDYILFALTAAFAVCTKDQAYGLYALPAIAIVWREYSRAPNHSPVGRIRFALRREILAAAFVAAASFVVFDNLVFGRQSFIAHVRFITGTGAQPFRMFPATLAGQWDLLRGAAMVTRVSWGWPAFVLCISGFVWSLWKPDETSRRLHWLLVPAISYHLTFTAVVGYTYDRFLLPIFVVLSLCAGFAVSRIERLTGGVFLARLGIVCVLLYSVAYVNVVNVALLRDSRYDAETWMASNIPPGKTIGIIGSPEHAPRIENWYYEFVNPTPQVIQTLGFDYLVVNADWAERFEPGRLQREGVERLLAGQTQFRQIFEARNPIGFAGMPLLSRLAPFGDTGYSILTKLNPTTIVFKRSPGTPAPTARTP